MTSDTGRSDSRNSRSSRTLSTSTTTSSSKFSNLLAAKSVLGIDDSVNSNSRLSNSASTVQSASSSLVGGERNIRAPGQSHMERQGLGPPTMSPSQYSRSAGSSRGSGRGNTNVERQLTLYSAREDKSSVASSAKREMARGSYNSTTRGSIASNTSSAAYSRSSSARREMARGGYSTRGSIASNTTTLDVGSEQDSLTGSGGSPTRRSHDNNSSMRSNLDSLNSSPPSRRNDHNNSSMKSNLSMSSKMVSSTYERKTNLSIGGEEEQLLNSTTTRSGMRKQQFRHGANGSDNGTGQQTLMSLHENEEGVSQSSTNNDDSLYATSLSKISTYDDNSSYQTSTTSSFARFIEMKSLLMAITPMQLESLIIQILESNNDSNNSDSSSLISIVQRWEGTNDASRRLKFRKDAQLIDFSLAELKRYASNKEITGIQACSSMEEAMDLFTLEFERLVSNNGRSANGRSITNGDDDGKSSYNDNDENDTVNDMQELCTSLTDRSTSSNCTRLIEGWDTLQSSLSACTLPELRLIAERLNLQYDGSDKAELILLIENSMLPDDDVDESQQSSSNGIDNSQSSEFSRQSSSVQQRPRQQSSPPRGKKRNKKLMMDDYSSTDSRDMTDAEYYAKYGPGEEDDGFGDSSGDNNYYPRQNSSAVEEENTSNHRKVKFARDTKKDKSHLAPKREKEGGWRSFVVGSNVVSDDADTDDDDGERALVPRNHYGAKRSYNDDDDDDYDDMFETNRTKYRPRIGLPSLPKRLRGQKVRELFSIFLLIALVVGLSVGLTLKNKRQDTEPDYDSIRADPDDPIYQSFLISKSPSMTPSLAVTPLLRPVVASDVVGFSISTPVPGQYSTKSPSQELVFSKQPTQQPALSIDVSQPDDEVQQLFCAASEAELELSCATAESCISNPCPPKKFCFPFTCTEVTSSLENNSLSTTIAPTENAANSPSSLAVIATSEPSTIVVVSTYQPTEALSIDEVYPLIGPVDEPGMRMILYGVSPFDHMGRTQYAMLTAAYVEQFYNSETKGEDSVQNIVYDVATSISLEDGELLGGDSSRRVFQVEPGIIVTFTMTISYHTFSASIDLKTITNRPFYDEDMRASYLKYMVDAGAVTHMGIILNVSPIFYGDDLPEPPSETIDLTPAPSPILDMDIEEIPSLPELLVPEVTTYEPSPSTTLEIITTTLVEDIITPDPSSLPVMTVEPSPATTLMDTITPTTTTRPSSTPSGEVMDSESSESESPLTVTLEPSPATTPMDTTMPTTTTRPSSTPSGKVMDSESSESETPTYQPIEIITAQDSDP